MYEYAAGTERDPPDGLFQERLEAFMEKSLTDIKTFSERERRPFEETRMHIAQWHCQYLFRSAPSTAVAFDSTAQVRAILCDTSRILESLYEASGVHSFILAVDPNNDADQGFLGGTLLAREFWRGYRGGGDTGAKAFKLHCIESAEPKDSNDDVPHDPVASSSVTEERGPKRTPASTVKAQVYARVRNALRSVSGVRNAEMKWTNPERLSVYGVRLVSWPSGIPAQNPSSLNLTQNKTLLESLERGAMRFVKIRDNAGEVPTHNKSEDPMPAESSSTADSTGYASWSCENDAQPPLGSYLHTLREDEIYPPVGLNTWGTMHEDPFLASITASTTPLEPETPARENYFSNPATLNDYWENPQSPTKPPKRHRSKDPPGTSNS